MIDIALIEEAPLFESIRTMTEHRRERILKSAQRQRKGHCVKQAYSRKQALTQRNFLLTREKVPYLNTYKCPKCGFWHLTHRPPREPKV